MQPAKVQAYGLSNEEEFERLYKLAAGFSGCRDIEGLRFESNDACCSSGC